MREIQKTPLLSLTSFSSLGKVVIVLHTFVRLRVFDLARINSFCESDGALF